MKKTIALLLAIMMLCTVLVGCGDNKTQNDNNDSPTKGYVLRLGTDAVGGTANTALEAMSAIVNQKTDMKTSTVVTTGAAALADAQLAHRQRHVVGDDQHVVCRHLVEPGRLAHGLAGQIHVRLGLHHQYLIPVFL